MMPDYFMNQGMSLVGSLALLLHMKSYKITCAYKKLPNKSNYVRINKNYHSTLTGYCEKNTLFSSHFFSHYKMQDFASLQGEWPFKNGLWPCHVYLALATHSIVTSDVPVTTLVFLGGMMMVGAMGSAGPPTSTVINRLSHNNINKNRHTCGD